MKESTETRHSKLTFLSNATGQLCSTLIGSVQGFTLFYYQVVIGLSPWLVVLAMGIFAVYDAINDPIMGFLIDRNLRFTRKWGRRFPWIVVGVIPWLFSIYLLFSVPDIDPSTNPGAVFGWLLIVLFLVDTFGTLVNMNYKLIQIEKFRTEYERQRFSKYYTPLDILAILVGMLLPPLFVDLIPGDPKASYSMMGVFVSILALIFAILSWPGNREDKIMIDKYFSPEGMKRMNFIKAFIEALKSKSYMVWFIFVICNGIRIALVIQNMLYVTTFVLQADALAYTIILGMYLLGTVISVPFWVMFIRKTNNNKKAFIVAGLAACTALFPLSFFQGFTDITIMAFILGIANGGLNTYIYTIMVPSVYEDYVVKTGKNQKGVLVGIGVLLGRLVTWIDEFIFATVHMLTGFVAGKQTYSQMVEAVGVDNIGLVLIGIRLLQGFIPALVLLFGVLIMWKFFPLTQERILENKVKMKELGF